MKKFVFVSLLLAMSAASYSQDVDAPEILTKADYLKKSSGQRTAGAILLITGSTLNIIATLSVITQTADEIGRGIGGIIDPSNPPPPPKNNKAVNGVLFFTGTVAIISGISLLVAAGKNKRKAASVSFKNEKSLQFQNNALVYQHVPSLSLKINF